MRASNLRAALAFVHDAIAVFVAWALAFLLRFNFEVPLEFERVFLVTVGWVLAIDAAVFLAFRLYRGLWRYASIHDLKLLLVAVGVASLSVPTAIVLVHPGLIVPRSVYVLHPLLLAAIMAGARLTYRAWKDRNIGRLGALSGKPVVVFGAGDTAVSLLKSLAGSREWRVIGLLDDDQTKLGRLILGTPVLAPIDSLREVALRHGVEHAIIAMPSTSHRVRKRIVDLCRQSGVKALTVPSFEDLMSGRVSVSQIRDVELDDLLGRDPVKLDSPGLRRLLDGQTVLVTGAGGSIGSELCRQIARFNPGQLVLVDISEHALYQMEEEFRSRLAGIPVHCVVCDVRNESRVDQVLSAYRPRILFHAAAYKHVPLMETGNAWEALHNNSGGTYVLGKAAIRHGVGKFVLVSTDKAVNPVNVMGATKRLAEMICQALHRQGATRFVLVRFGNVLGSAGSVIPKFKKQIAEGGPVTVTHPEITRYFMSIPEAAQLVLQAALMGEGGEIFVLDMGEPVKIVDLARDLIRLSGLSEDEMRIVFTGLRPGEKLYEELLADGESTLPTPHPKLRVARSRAVGAGLLEDFAQWFRAAEAGADPEVRERLQAWVPEYDTQLAQPARPRTAGGAGS
jgi:FlaA1/EpsC-like NDP-sugar epimerase